MSKTLAKFILASMLIVGIITITIIGIYKQTQGGMIMGEDGVLGMALTTLINYDTRDKKETA